MTKQKFCVQEKNRKMSKYLAKICSKQSEHDSRHSRQLSPSTCRVCCIGPPVVANSMAWYAYAVLTNACRVSIFLTFVNFF